jgi:hypothetical protein
MTMTFRALSSTLMATALAGVLAGCGMSSSERLVGTDASASAPQQLAPVTNSSVNTGSLPPLAGTNQLPAPAPSQVAPGLSGTPVLGGVPPATQTQAQTQTQTQTQTPGTTDGSFVSLDDVGQTASLGTDLAGGLTQTNVQGGWTLASGATQCRLNVTATPKEGTSRFRASTPGCQIQGLSTVASYQIAGNQVQLYNEAGSQVAVLILSGNRLIGTGTGGIALSMSR